MTYLTSKTFKECLAESELLREELHRQQDKFSRQQKALLEEAKLAVAQIPIGTKFQHNGVEYEVTGYSFEDYEVKAGGFELYLCLLKERYDNPPFFLIIKSDDAFKDIPVCVEQYKVMQILADAE